MENPYKDKNGLAEIKTLIFVTETRAIPPTMKLTNIAAPDHLNRLLLHAVFFQGPTKERWKRFQDSSKLKLYSVLSFDCRTNFLQGTFALCYHFQWKG